MYIAVSSAALTTYNVQVYTGDAFGAGTDANVYIILFGEKDHTSMCFLLLIFVCMHIYHA